MDKHIGEKYGVYTIIDVLPDRAKDGHLVYKGRCGCGEELCTVLSQFVRQKDFKQCPHYSVFGEITIKRGLIKNRRIAQIFYSMLRRCYDENNKDYKYYGGKGIRVYQEWIDRPDDFEKWALSNGYKQNLTIDRIYENRNYEPDNCQWVDAQTNARFKSNTNYITARATLSGKQWASLIPDVGINYINRMMKNKGEGATVQFIESKLCNKHTSFNNQDERNFWIKNNILHIKGKFCG